MEKDRGAGKAKPPAGNKFFPGKSKGIGKPIKKTNKVGDVSGLHKRASADNTAESVGKAPDANRQSQNPSLKSGEGLDGKSWRDYRHMQKIGKRGMLPFLSEWTLHDEEKRKGPGWQHYKRPYEKLLKRVKQEGIAEFPADVNIHKRRPRRASFIGGRGVEKEVVLIRNILNKHGKKVQPKIGWEYNKRQKRLLLGFRHRKLEHGWRFLEPMKDLLPRHVKPNYHLPDAIFYFLNIIMFLTTGVFGSTLYTLGGLDNLLEDIQEYEYFVKGDTSAYRHKLGHHFWKENAPYENYASIYAVSAGVMCTSILLGFVGVYLADQRLHVVYVVGVAASLWTQGVASLTEQKDNFCVKVLKTVTPLIKRIMDDYYQEVDVHDLNGEPLSWRNPMTNETEPVKIRTYRAANLMDRVQTGFHCCGLYGYGDYIEKDVAIPSSCCTPLWNLNPYCAKVVPWDVTEFQAKFFQNDEGGCKQRFETYCINTYRLLGETATLMCDLQLGLFAFSCMALIMQARQIRQLRRRPHLRISAGSISQSLQTTASHDAAGGVTVLGENQKLTDKQMGHLEELRRESGLAKQHEKEEESLSTSSSSELPVHTVNFTDMDDLQDFVDTEDRPNLEKPGVEKAVEGFAGRFNIVANKNLQNYVTGIFSSTYQNETNAALDAISHTLERQFAQHTTDYDWRKLLKKTGRSRDPRSLLASERRAATESNGKAQQPEQIKIKRISDPKKRPK